MSSRTSLIPTDSGYLQTTVAHEIVVMTGKVTHRLSALVQWINSDDQPRAWLTVIASQPQSLFASRVMLCTKLQSIGVASNASALADGAWGEEILQALLTAERKLQAEDRARVSLRERFAAIDF